jgi:hypothetical protein
MENRHPKKLLQLSANRRYGQRGDGVKVAYENSSQNDGQLTDS